MTELLSRLSCIPNNPDVPSTITLADYERWLRTPNFQRKSHSYQILFQSRYLDPLFSEYWIGEELLKIRDARGMCIYTPHDVQTAVIKISQMMPNDWRSVWLAASQTVRVAQGLAPGKITVMVPLDRNYCYIGYSNQQLK